MRHNTNRATSDTGKTNRINGHQVVYGAKAYSNKSSEMSTYSNEAVLEALRRVQYRQVPWARRPVVFEYLRGLGLMDTVRQRTVAPAPGFHAPVDIAVLTDRGRAEFARLARDERSLQWSSDRVAVYAAPLVAQPGVGAPQ